MTPEQILLLILFPLVLILGKLISKTSNEEIQEVRPTTNLITKTLILFAIYLAATTHLSTTTTIIITTLALIHLIFITNIAKEKVIIAITSSLAIIALDELKIIIGLIAIFFWGLTSYNIHEKLLSKHTAVQSTLFFFMLSFKFIIIHLITKT
ncbi:MAG: hypothetical protein ACLFN8_02855 [Candidatus Woesearchaeota archaeon]